MQSIYQPSLIQILPDSILRDPKLRATAEAIEVELTRLSAATREVLHLPRLDELSGKILDYLAEQFHIDFWEPLHLSDDEKKNLIRTSIAWHRIKGTPAAVEQIANAAFRAAEVVEWFDYGGRPYHFQIHTHGFKGTPDGFATFMRMLDCAKNVRSWCEKIIIDYPSAKLHLYYGVAPIVSGRKVANIAKPADLQCTLFAGIVPTMAGRHGAVTPARPADAKVALNVGQVLIKSGRMGMPADTGDINRFINWRQKQQWQNAN